MSKLTLQQIEPFAHGFLQCKSENISMRIASGMYSICEYIPIEIHPQACVAALDRHLFTSFISQVAVRYDCGCGMICRPGTVEERIKKYPEYEKEIREYQSYFSEFL